MRINCGKGGLRGEPTDDPLLPAVLHTIAVFNLDLEDFEKFLHSMAMDITVTSYPTYDDLLVYMEGSAAVIGRNGASPHGLTCTPTDRVSGG